MSSRETRLAAVEDDAQRSTTKIVKVGNSLGLILSKDMLAHMKVGRGDLIYLTESPDGFTISPYNPDVTRQIEAGKRFMKTYRETFRALAK